MSQFHLQMEFGNRHFVNKHRIYLAFRFNPNFMRDCVRYIVGRSPKAQNCIVCFCWLLNLTNPKYNFILSFLAHTIIHSLSFLLSPMNGPTCVNIAGQSRHNLKSHKVFLLNNHYKIAFLAPSYYQDLERTFFSFYFFTMILCLLSSAEREQCNSCSAHYSH